jgi:hypothetical protein
MNKGTCKHQVEDTAGLLSVNACKASNDAPPTLKVCVKTFGRVSNHSGDLKVWAHSTRGGLNTGDELTHHIFEIFCKSAAQHQQRKIAAAREDSGAPAGRYHGPALLVLLLAQ